MTNGKPTKAQLESVAKVFNKEILEKEDQFPVGRTARKIKIDQYKKELHQTCTEILAKDDKDLFEEEHVKTMTTIGVELPWDNEPKKPKAKKSPKKAPAKKTEKKPGQQNPALKEKTKPKDNKKPNVTTRISMIVCDNPEIKNDEIEEILTKEKYKYGKSTLTVYSTAIRRAIAYLKETGKIK